MTAFKVFQFSLLLVLIANCLLSTGKKDKYCNRVCNKLWAPVCGTDGVTYGNKCELGAQNCDRKVKVGLMHRGECLPGERDKKCDRKCNQKKKAPVCGTDGVTYINADCLRAKNCDRKVKVKVFHKGKCVKGGKDCNRKCNQKKKDPVCGTDGVTYINADCLRAKNCDKKVKVKVLHKGKCVKGGKEKCDRKCPLIWAPVCGTDGVTYGNQRCLEAHNCDKKVKVKVLHKGQCVEEEDCFRGCILLDDPVCGTDGKTYGNDDCLRAANCDKEDKVDILHYGECSTTGEIEPGEVIDSDEDY